MALVGSQPQFFFAEILSLVALVFFPLLSCGFVNSLRVLVVWVLLGIDLWEDKIFGSLRTSSRCSSWLWSELILFCVRLRKPQQNPILTVFSNLRLIYKSDWAQYLWRPWKHIFQGVRKLPSQSEHVCFSFAFKNQISSYWKSTLDSDAVLYQFGIFGVRFAIRSFYLSRVSLRNIFEIMRSLGLLMCFSCQHFHHLDWSEVLNFSLSSKSLIDSHSLPHLDASSVLHSIVSIFCKVFLLNKFACSLCVLLGLIVYLSVW